MTNLKGTSAQLEQSYDTNFSVSEPELLSSFKNRLSPGTTVTSISGQIDLLEIINNSNYYISTIEYNTDEYIAGVEIEFNVEKYTIKDIIVKFGNDDSEVFTKKYLTQFEANQMVSYFDPSHITDITSANSYITKSSNDRVFAYVLLQRNGVISKIDSTAAVFDVKKFTAAKNIQDNSSSGTDNIMSHKSELSNWDPETFFVGTGTESLKFLKNTAQFSISDLYNEQLDINYDLNIIDVLDVVAMSNYYFKKKSGNLADPFVPAYVGSDTVVLNEDDFTKTDFKISDVNFKETEEGYFTLNIDIDFNTSIPAHGFQFDIGRNFESYSFYDEINKNILKPEVVFKGQLEELKNYYDFRVISIDNRFGWDNITRVIIYQKPRNGNQPSALFDISKQLELLSDKGIEPRENIETLISLQWTSVKKVNSLNLKPKQRFYLKNDFRTSSSELEGAVNNWKIGDEWFGSVSYDSRTRKWYTGLEYNPFTSIELKTKFDFFGMLNRKVVTNSVLKYIKHYTKLNQGLKNYGYEFAYPEENDPDQLKVLEQFGNDYQVYAESVLGYINNPIWNGLGSSELSKYTSEPTTPEGYIAGYMNDHDLSGTKSIIDLTTMSNLFTIRLSGNSDSENENAQQNIASSVKNLLKTKDLPLEKFGGNTATRTINEKCSVSDTKKVLDTLNKVVPSFLIDENNTLAYPDFHPNPNQNETDSSIMFFSELVECKQNNVPDGFRNWKHFFENIYNIDHSLVPKKQEFCYFEIKVASNSNEARFFSGLDIEVDFGDFFGSTKLNNNHSDGPSGTDKVLYLNLGNSLGADDYTITNYVTDTGSNVLLPDNSANTFDKLLINLNKNASKYGVGITSDGGPLTVLRCFVSDIPNFIGGEKAKFLSNANAKIKWTGLPLDDSTSVSYREHNKDDKLILGPELSYFNLFYKENSSSRYTYDDVSFHITLLDKKTLSLSCVSNKPVNSGSVELSFLDDEVAVSLLSSSATLYGDSTAGYTFNTNSSNSGINKHTISFNHSSNYISGSTELCQIQLDKNIFDHVLTDSSNPAMEITYPPQGESKTLVSAYVDQTNIYPTFKNILYHIDSSNSKTIEINNASDNRVVEVSNAFDPVPLSPTSNIKRPVYLNEKEYGTGNKSLNFYTNEGTQILSTNLGQFDSSKNFTALNVFYPDTVEQNTTQTVLEYSSTNCLFRINVYGGVYDSIANTYTTPRRVEVYISGSASPDPIQANYELQSDSESLGPYLVSIHTDSLTANETSISSRKIGIKLNGANIISPSDPVFSNVTEDLTLKLGYGTLAGATAYDGSIAEIILLNSNIPENELIIYEGTLMQKWGFSNKLSTSHKYYNNTTDITNAQVINSSDAKSISITNNYPVQKQFLTDATRYSSEVINNSLHISNALVSANSIALDLSNTNNTVNKLVESKTAASDSRIFIKEYNNKTGMGIISYQSNKRIDGFQVEFGNFKNNIEEYELPENSDGHGIIDTNSSELLSRLGWNAPLIGKGTDQLVNENINKLIIGFGPIDNSNNNESPYMKRIYGNYALPSTKAGESEVLCYIQFDPNSFNGAPVVQNYVLASNDNLTTAGSGFKGANAAGDNINFTDSLNNVIRFAQLGYYKTNSSDSSIATLANNYDSDNTGVVNVVDILSVKNHLVANGYDAALNLGTSIVPEIYSTDNSNLPLISSISVTSSSCDDGSYANINWIVDSTSGDIDNYQIFRRQFNSSSVYIQKNQLLKKTQLNDYELIKTLPKNKLTFKDRNIPINIMATQQSENPIINYMVVATNENGSHSITASDIQFGHCSNIFTAEDLNVNTTRGREVILNPSFFSNDFSKPHGINNSHSGDGFALNFSLPNKNVGDIIQAKGHSIFYPNQKNQEFVGTISGEYTVTNIKTGASIKKNYYINILPKQFSLQYVQSKNRTKYSNKIMFNRNVVGDVTRFELYRKLSTETSYTMVNSQNTSNMESSNGQFIDEIAIPTAGAELYNYKVKAITIDNIFIESEILNVTNNIGYALPVVNATTLVSDCNTVQHPLFKATWTGATDTNNENPVSYTMYETDQSGNILNKIETVPVSSTGLYDISTQPLKKFGCTGTYTHYYKIVGRSKSNIETASSVMTATFDKCALTPTVEDVEISFCSDKKLTGDLNNYVSNYSDNNITFAMASAPVTGLTVNSNGTFEFEPSSAGTYSFNYNATSCSKTSSSKSITFVVTDVCIECPEDYLRENILCRYGKVNSEHDASTEPYSSAIPFSYKDRHVSNIRGRDDVYTVKLLKVKKNHK